MPFNWVRTFSPITLGRRMSVLDPFPHQADVLVHVGGKIAHAAQPIVVVLDGFKAQGIDRAFDRLNAVKGVGANQIPLVRLAGEIVAGVVVEDVVADLILRRKLGAVDGVQLGENFAGMLEGLPGRLSGSSPATCRSSGGLPVRTLSPDRAPSDNPTRGRTIGEGLSGGVIRRVRKSRKARIE